MAQSASCCCNAELHRVDKFDQSLPEKIVLSKPNTFFGRSKSKCDVIFASKTQPRCLSRVHAKIFKVARSGKWDWYIIDHRSLNGTFVNNHRVNQIQLKSGDYICFGMAKYDKITNELNISSCAQRDEKLDRIINTFDNSEVGSCAQRRNSDSTQIEHKLEYKFVFHCTCSDVENESSALGRNEKKRKCIASETVRRGMNLFQPCALLQRILPSCSPSSAKVKRIRMKSDADEDMTRKNMEAPAETPEKEEAKAIHLETNGAQDPINTIIPTRAEIVSEEPNGKVSTDSTETAKMHQDLVTADTMDDSCLPFTNVIMPLEIGGDLSDVTADSGDQCSYQASDDEGWSSQDTVNKVANTATRKPCGPSCCSLKQVEPKIDTSKDKALNMLIGECTCPICHDPFVVATTLECGHSFCKVCIDSWIREHRSCPVCRVVVFKPPIRSTCLDNTTGIALLGNPTLNEEWIKRKEQIKLMEIQELKTKSELEDCLTDAQQKGFRFLCIQNPWNKREKRRFKKGVKRHSGASRVAYCSSIGLTPTYVAGSHLSQLQLAAVNLCLKDLDALYDSERRSVDISRLRNRLLLYITHG